MLTAALEAPRWAEALTAAHAWLGEAIAIKDPTVARSAARAAATRSFSAQQPQAALAMEVVALTSLAAQHSGDAQQGTQFYVLDGSPPDAMHAGYWQRAAATFPQRCKVGGTRDSGLLIGEIAAELAKRQTDGAVGAGEIYSSSTICNASATCVKRKTISASVAAKRSRTLGSNWRRSCAKARRSASTRSSGATR